MASDVKVRDKWIDPWFNREPKTEHYCMMCQRDIKPDQPYRIIHWELDSYCAIHRDDLELARTVIERPIESGPIGMTCAKKLGLQWSIAK